ncbi:MAG: hypothetical protein H6981_01380 [Gammaproteobacteria bacterium]|nr:hypothetical protein [Gammaproteobacteria bacterium]MCP5135438.1 hypothetical protein [Gammaproteobacteria bacterium]
MNTRLRRNPTTSPEKHRDIDLGLSVLCAVARPGQTLSCRDIADVCGCSHQAIYYMEKHAREKIRTIGARKGLPEYLREAD